MPTAQLGDSRKHWHRKHVGPFLDLLVDGLQIVFIDDPSALNGLLLFKAEESVLNPVLFSLT